MSRTRRNFSAKFKSELVIELLKGEKDLNTIATENNIQPNLLRNCFKFQSDSINTCSSGYSAKIGSSFKFQSDSINTTMRIV